MSKINLELAKEKGLIINEDQSKYDELVKKYKYLLEYYIDSKMNLFQYEELINNSGLSIGKNSKYKSLHEYLKLDYIYLLNNLFIEKLSIEDINLLEKIDLNNNEVINFIERTYKDIIYDNYFKGEYQNNIYKVCYGPVVPFNFVDNDSLVLKIYYGKNLIDVDGEEFIKLHEKQLAFFDKLIEKIKNDFKEKLNIKCEVLLEKDIY